MTFLQNHPNTNRVEPSAYWALGLLFFVAFDVLLLLPINMHPVCVTAFFTNFLTIYLQVSNQNTVVLCFCCGGIKRHNSFMVGPVIK